MQQKLKKNNKTTRSTVTCYQEKQIRSSELVAQIGTKVSKYKVTERKNTESLETDRWKDRQIDRQTDRQADRQRCSHKIAQAANRPKYKFTCDTGLLPINDALTLTEASPWLGLLAGYYFLNSKGQTASNIETYFSEYIAFLSSLTYASNCTCSVSKNVPEVIFQTLDWRVGTTPPPPTAPT